MKLLSPKTRQAKLPVFSFAPVHLFALTMLFALTSSLSLGCSDEGNNSVPLDGGRDAELDDGGPVDVDGGQVDYEIDLSSSSQEVPVSRALLGHYDLSGALFSYDEVPGLSEAMESAGFSDWRTSVGRWEAASWLLPTLTDGTPCTFPLPQAFAPTGWSDLDLIAARDWFTDNGSPVSLADTEDNTRYSLDYLHEMLGVVDAFGAEPFVSLDHMPRALAANRTPLRSTETTPDACQWTFTNTVSNTAPADPQIYAAAVTGLVRRVVEGHGDYSARAIRYWEIGNEPEFCLFWDPFPGNGLSCPDDSIADRLSAFFETAIHTLVALGSYRDEATQPNASQIRLGLGSFAYPETAALTLEEFDAASFPIPLDFVSFHAYDTDPRTILQAIQLVAEARADTSRYPDIEIVLSEWGPTLDAIIDPTGMDQPLLMSTVLVLGAAAGLHRAHHTFFWNYFPQDAILWGLVDYTGTPLPLHRAYVLLSRALAPDGVRLIPDTLKDGKLSPSASPPDDLNALLLTRDPTGTHRAMVIHHGDETRTLRLRLDGIPLSPTSVESLHGEADALQQGAWQNSTVSLPPRSLTLIAY